MNENEKDKENKKTSEAESYEDYEGGEMEDGEEGSGMGKISISEESLSLALLPTPPDTSCSETELLPETSLDSFGKKQRLLMEKWLSVTGKKPKNIPTLRKFEEEALKGVIFFGDRKPTEVEKKIKENFLIATNKIRSLGVTYGKVSQEIMLPPLSGGLLNVKIHPAGEKLIMSTRKGKIQVRTMSTGELFSTIDTFEATERASIRTMRFHCFDHSRIYMAGDSGIVQVYEMETGQRLGMSPPLLTMINIMDLSVDCRYLATGGREGRIDVIDPFTLQAISSRAWPSMDESTSRKVYDKYHRLRIYGIKFHPNEPNLFLTGGWDHSIKIWDVRMLPAVRSFESPPIHGDGLDMEDNKVLTVSCQVDKSLNLWDFRTGKLIKNVAIKVKATKFEGEFLYCGKFLKNHSINTSNGSNAVAIAGSGFNGTIIVNIETGEAVEYFPAFKPVLCMDIWEKKMAYGGKESLLRVVDVDSTPPKAGRRQR